MKRRAWYLLLLVIALVLGMQQVGYHQLERWLSPEAVQLREVYADQKTGEGFDHSTFDSVLGEFVTPNGRVRYTELLARPAALDEYLAQLAKADFEPLSRDAKFALLINAYNAFTLRLILDHWPLKSIQDIPSAQRWDARRWRIGALQLSLNDIEHRYLRERFRDPRLHFAINCASIGCPPLRRETYQSQRLETQLQQQSQALHADKAWLDLDRQAQTIRLTRLYLWFESDFRQVSGTTLDFAGRFHQDLAAELTAGRTPGIDWIEYDWQLNLAR